MCNYSADDAPVIAAVDDAVALPKPVRGEDQDVEEGAEPPEETNPKRENEGS